MDELAEQIGRAAYRAVSISKSRNGRNLDYSEASLAIVEEMLNETAYFAAEMTSARLSKLVEDFGCYILEVGHREFDGRYLWHEERDQPVLVVGEPSFRVSMLTWDKVRSRIGGDESDNIPFHYAGFAEKARQAIPGTEVLYI